MSSIRSALTDLKYRIVGMNSFVIRWLDLFWFKPDNWYTLATSILSVHVLYRFGVFVKMGSEPRCEICEIRGQKIGAFRFDDFSHVPILSIHDIFYARSCLLYHWASFDMSHFFYLQVNSNQINNLLILWGGGVDIQFLHNRVTSHG